MRTAAAFVSFVLGCAAPVPDDGAEMQAEGSSSADTGEGSESSSSSDSGEPSTSSSTGEPVPTEEAFAQTCAAQLDADSCNGIEPVVTPDAVMSCRWEIWVPVVSTDGACEFGEPAPACVMELAFEAPCSGPSGCGFELVGSRIVDGGVWIAGVDEGCFAPGDEICRFDQRGQLAAGPPECACLCDPAFPGRP